MLNYMKSEWYRQRNNRGLQNTILVCLGLIILMVAVLAFSEGGLGSPMPIPILHSTAFLPPCPVFSPSHWFLPALWRITPATDSLP